MTILVICVSHSKLAECVHAAFTSVEKHCPVISFCWLALRFREITYAKKRSVLQAASFVDVLLNEQQKKP